MKRLNCTRAKLAILSLLALIVFGVLGFFYGDKLTSNALQLITTIVVLIGADLKSAFGFLFDGTPKQETTETKEPQL